MEDDSERDREIRELCDSVIQIFDYPEAQAETYLTHAFFLRTIREQRLAGKSLERVVKQGLPVYPVWMIQSGQPLAVLLNGAITEMDVDMMIRRARIHSPRFESCGFLPKDDFVRFVQQIEKATSLRPVASQVTASLANPHVHGWIYADRPFTMIRIAKQPIEVTSQHQESPPGRSAQSS